MTDKKKSSTGIGLAKRIVSLSGAAILVALTWYTLHNKDADYNEYRCKTEKRAINGIITKVTGRSGYVHVGVNNVEGLISFDVREIKYKKGFGKYHDYAVGDSIIKDANSKDVTIKNKDSICLLSIQCDE
ncbi:hypothetical protein ACTHGU_20530 [Chitinophagaceae bacterium MMS25-I14]